MNCDLEYFSPIIQFVNFLLKYLIALPISVYRLNAI